MRPLQRRKDRLRFQPGVRPDLLHDPRPHLGELILPRSPVPVRPSTRSANAALEGTSAPSSHPCQPSTPLSPAFPQCSTICTASLSAGLSPCERRSPSASRIVSTSLPTGRNNCRQQGTISVADHITSRQTRAAQVWRSQQRPYCSCNLSSSQHRRRTDLMDQGNKKGEIGLG